MLSQSSTECRASGRRDRSLRESPAVGATLTEGHCVFVWPVQLTGAANTGGKDPGVGKLGGSLASL